MAWSAAAPTLAAIAATETPFDTPTLSEPEEPYSSFELRRPSAKKYRRNAAKGDHTAVGACFNTRARLRGHRPGGAGKARDVAHVMRNLGGYTSKGTQDGFAPYSRSCALFEFR